MRVQVWDPTEEQRQVDWMNNHGGDLAGYIAFYKDLNSLDAEQAEAIYWADYDFLVEIRFGIGVAMEGAAIRVLGEDYFA